MKGNGCIKVIAEGNITGWAGVECRYCVRMVWAGPSMWTRCKEHCSTYLLTLFS